MRPRDDGRRAGPLALILTSLGLFACTDPVEAPVGERALPLAAICAVDVEGVGRLDVEEDYIPHVVQCENGAADFQALKAQAVAARSYMYYRMQTGGSIGDGQHDQVYSCGREPTAEQRRAARETAGQVVSYRDTVVAAFYVAGAIPGAPDCVATPQDRDPTNTERYVTYNQGRSGDDLIQTPLGWVNPGNLRNRGCKSQNGANCLSRQGWDYTDILRFYYGADITLEQSVGACVPLVEPDMGPPPVDLGPPPVDMGPPVDIGPSPVDMGPPPPDAGPAPDAAPPGECPAAGDSPAIVDDSDRCFTFGCATGEWGVGLERGFNGGMLLAPTIDADASDCRGTWRGMVRRRGEYDLAVYVEQGPRALTRAARYHVRHADGEDTVTLDQRIIDGWAPLGRFTFDPSAPVEVWLGDASGEPFSPEGPRVAYDALRISPPGAPMGDAGPDPEPEPDVGLGPHPDGSVDLPIDAIAADDADACAAAPGGGGSGAGWLLLVGLLAGLRRARSGRLAG